MEPCPCNQCRGVASPPEPECPHCNCADCIHKGVCCWCDVERPLDERYHGARRLGAMYDTWNEYLLDRDIDHRLDGIGDDPDGEVAA